jgi:hypothetical protein
MLCFLVSALTPQAKCSFHGLFSAISFAILCLLLISLFKMTLKCIPDMLSNIPKSKKVVAYLTENMAWFGHELQLLSVNSMLRNQ